MLTLRVIHAHFGDCLLLIHGNKDRFWLVDGGPKDTFVPHLKAVLEKLKQPALDVVCLSHVDTDHTTGLQELFAELRDQASDGEDPLATVGDFWINQFSATLDADGAGPNGTREARLARVFQAVSGAGAMSLASAALSGIKHGAGLVVLAQQLKIPINKANQGKPWINGAQGTFQMDKLDVTVVGPTQANLDELKAAWDTWLDEQEMRIANGQLDLAAMKDKSIPNLSSIQLLVETQGKRLLLTGDGRGDHLLQAVEEAQLLDAKGFLDVDVLKLPHHGSDRNVSLEFFEQIRAKTYVASADGTDDNPDKPTLEWILKAAKKQKRHFELVLTNLPPDAEEFVAQNPPDKNNYKLRVRDPADNFIDVHVAQ